MKKQFPLYLFILFTWTIQAQSFSLEWKSNPNERLLNNEASAFPNPTQNTFTDDYDGDGSRDLVWISDDRSSLVVVNGNNRNQRRSFAIDIPTMIRPKNLEVYFLSGIRTGSVEMILVNNENLSGGGTRSDDQVMIENNVITYPQDRVLLEAADYDQDGSIELMLYNRGEHSSEIWGL